MSEGFGSDVSVPNGYYLCNGKVRKIPAYKTPESAVKNACIGWLVRHGVFCWRNNTGAVKTDKGSWIKFGCVGSPDILGMTWNGRWLGIECKSSTGRLEPEQEAFRSRVEACGGLYIVARSIDDLEAHKLSILS